MKTMLCWNIKICLLGSDLFSERLDVKKSRSILLEHMNYINPCKMKWTTFRLKKQSSLSILLWRWTEMGVFGCCPSSSWIHGDADSKSFDRGFDRSVYYSISLNLSKSVSLKIYSKVINNEWIVNIDPTLFMDLPQSKYHQKPKYRCLYINSQLL